MKDKVQFVIIALLGIVAFILFFGFVLSNIDPNNKLEAYTLAISFVGIFATFGGAYLGAKIAGDNAIKIHKENLKAQIALNEVEKNQKLIEQLELNREKLDFIELYLTSLSEKEILMGFEEYPYLSKTVVRPCMISFYLNKLNEILSFVESDRYVNHDHKYLMPVIYLKEFSNEIVDILEMLNNTDIRYDTSNRAFYNVHNKTKIIQKNQYKELDQKCKKVYHENINITYKTFTNEALRYLSEVLDLTRENIYKKIIG